MTDRPYGFTIRSSDDRRIASLLVGELNVISLELDGRSLTVKAADYNEFTRGLLPLAASQGISVFEVIPMDESLESVFTYLVEGQSA
jgi:ABC-2 type transport system ATP-binding protein